jgi:parallel beta-helix repeat protein
LFDSQIIGCYIHNCDQIGFKLLGNSTSITYSHVSYNNLAHKFAVNDEAGGSKFWNTTDAVCSHNEFDHNVGCGIWLDFENSGAEIDHNYVHDNTYNGIYQEIGGSATIEYNTCNNNGTEYTLQGWLDGAGIAVEASHDVIVRNNTLNGNKNGIGLIASERGDPSWQIQNVVVTGNTVIGTKWQTGMCWDGVCPEPWAGATWTNNTYQLIAGSDFLMEFVS